MRQRFFDHLDDLLLLAGCACISYGMALWHPVIFWVVTGLELIGLAVLIGVRNAHYRTAER